MGGYTEDTSVGVARLNTWKSRRLGGKKAPSLGASLWGPNLAEAIKQERLILPL